ncbi:CapA family protein [Schnuerera sp. xch1]|uniref:CapA family protein n=1 Tax=Schnuerera sp. xch1 TaxID=2874283 RepID=UPI001CC0001F|nr:CapA family protein [Schnuerera sp. xch1]MBZ2175969.1 CapA family protein [Schnuerera sp. xch1]
MKKILIAILILLASILSIISIENNGTIFHTKSEPIVDEKDSVEELPEDIIDKTEDETTTATLLAVGDIMFHMPQIKAAYIPELQTYDFTNAFKYVKKYINSADISIANFETVTCGNEIGFSGYPRFNSPIETLIAIKGAGFDILNTANNHSLDQGKKGLINTINYINQHEMNNIGTYKEPNNSILIEEVNEIKLAFLSYSYGFNGLESTLMEDEQSYMINKIDEDIIKEDIEKAKNLGVDSIVVFIHWGNEYEREPSQYQMELGRKMLEWGANIILGTHPHVVQHSDVVNSNGNDNFIIYSMGNFLSNQRQATMGNKYTEDGVMINIELEKNFSDDKTIIKDITYIPTWVRKYKEEEGTRYEILPIEDFLEDKRLFIQLNNNERARIDESYSDTIDVMFEY